MQILQIKTLDYFRSIPVDNLGDWGPVFTNCSTSPNKLKYIQLFTQMANRLEKDLNRCKLVVEDFVLVFVNLSK